MDDYSLDRFSPMLTHRFTRRKTLQAVAGGATGIRPSPPTAPPSSQGAELDPVGTAGSRLRAVVKPDDLPLPIVRLSVDEPLLDPDHQ